MIHDLIGMYNTDDFEEPMYDPKSDMYFYPGHDSNDSEPDPDFS